MGKYHQPHININHRNFKIAKEVWKLEVMLFAELRSSLFSFYFLGERALL
jgi:hypothetical protein